jgi:hypothetical protein
MKTINEPQLPVVKADDNASQLMRRATDVAGVCKEIVLKTAVQIQGRKYVKCEGWMSIATAHGCIAGSRDVKKVEGGWTAIGEIRRISDGALLAQAEGFVGVDETKTWAQRPEYACRAMAQTRAISRACRAAFAHVVVLMDAGLSTTPAEEVPETGFVDEKPLPSPKVETKKPSIATEQQRAAMIQRLMQNNITAQEITDYARKSGLIKDNESPEDSWPLDKCPTNPEQMKKILNDVKLFVDENDLIP